MRTRSLGPILLLRELPLSRLLAVLCGAHLVIPGQQRTFRVTAHVADVFYSMDDTKHPLRLQALTQRLAHTPSDEGARAAAHFLRHVPIRAGMLAAVYTAIKGELDCAPLAASLEQRGATLFRVPVKGDAPIPDVLPDIVLVPFLSVDADGYRLGYGGGYYDRWIARVRAEKPGALIAGCGYEFQRCNEPLPRGPFDEKLDILVTEAGYTDFRP